MIFNSIRWRIQLWHGLLLVIVLAGFGFTAYQVARDDQWRRIDRELEQRLDAAFRPTGPMRPPPGSGALAPSPREFMMRLAEVIKEGRFLDSTETSSFYAVMWDENGSVLARSPGAPANIPQPERPDSGAARERFRPPGPLAARTRAEMREVFRPMPFGDMVLVGRSITPDLTAMRRLALSLIAAGAGVLMLGLAGGWWLATRAIRPIEAISAAAVRIAAGDLSQRINVADTESELGRLAGVLNSAFERLEAAFAQQARFTSDASHELRTPIAVILSQAQTTLSRVRPAPEYREALEACQRAAQRMRQLTESLLALARLDAGQEPMKHERFDLARIAGECVELIRPMASERGIEILTDLPGVVCNGDAERIGQVATNLLANAIQFNLERGAVRVSTRSEDGSALLVVADTGTGIPAADVPHIFERFFRADKSRAGNNGRSGLGLAICHAIVEAHHGSIAVDTEPGAGSTFTVRLPLNLGS